MKKILPQRPNLDHLRRQAKSLLAALNSGDTDAADTLLRHLPAAKRMSRERVRAAGFRLADAQSAVARKNGFAAWPQLARHVEQLRLLEGTWAFDHLEIGGAAVPRESLRASRLLIDGDRFRTESPEADYEGVFNIDVEAQPHQIDIDFAAGPEAGARNLGIFRVDGDRLELCLDPGGAARPSQFRTSAEDGCAYEVLRRTSRARPATVKDGPTPATDSGSPIARGSWLAERIVVDGRELPASMLKTARREVTGDELRITVGGKLVIHARVRIDDSKEPAEADYLILSGSSKGKVQFGIMSWRDGVAWSCMSPPGKPRPDTFESPRGSGRTLSQWRAAA